MKSFFNIKIILVSICFVLLYSKSSFATEEGTLKMQIVNSNNYWTGITISESYKACEELNNPSSTLGSSNVEAHLSTDYDWSAMAIFSASQYGDVGTNNKPTITTGTTNKSGIYNIGGKYRNGLADNWNFVSCPI